MMTRFSRFTFGWFIALSLLSLSGERSTLLASAQATCTACPLAATLELIGTGSETDQSGNKIITLAQGDLLTIRLTIANISISRNTQGYRIRLDLQLGQDPTQSIALIDRTESDKNVKVDTAFTCAASEPVSSTAAPPSEPTNLSTDNCFFQNFAQLPAGQKQIVKIQFDTGKQTADLGKEPFVIRNAQPGQTFVLNAKVLDAQQTGQVLLIDKQQSQTIRVIPQIVTLGFQGPIGLDPLSPNQGAVPQLSFRVANTGRARIEKRTAALFFSLLRKKPSQSSLPTVDLTLLIADACQVNADTSCTPLDVSEGRPLVPDVDADKFKELRVRFITSVLERGSYELHACMKKIASTARFCDPTERPSNSNPDLIDTFALTFDLSPPEGELRLNLESPPEIQQGKDVSLSLIFILENRTAVFLKSVALSFELRVDSVLPPGGTTLADCTELSGGSGTKILDGSKRQCVLTNLGPSQARRFQVKFPPSEYKTGQQLIITVSEASTFRVSAASFTLQVVETSTTPRPTTQQGPELHPLSLEFTPTSPVTQGQTVLIRSRIENSGSQFTGSFTVDFQIFKVDSTSGTIKFVAALGETRHFPGIDPSVTIEASTLLDTCARDASGKCTLELGTYIVKVVVSTVPNELDRTNNELSTLLTIQAPKK